MKKFIALLSTIVILLCLIVIPASAAGSVTVSTGSLSLKPGDTGTFTITATNAAGRVDISSSNPSVVKVTSSASQWVENGSVTVTVKAVENGSATINVTCTDVSDTDFNLITGTRTVAVSVATPVTTTASSAANLKSLEVKGYKLNETFSQWKNAYSVTVPEGTKSIDLSATALNGNSKVTGTGTLTISKLPQTFNIVVKASNGETKTYTLTVKQEAVAGLSGLTVAALCDLSPAFDASVYEYSVIVPAGTTSLIVDPIVDELSEDSAKVEVVGADDLAANGNKVVITVTSSDGVETTYTITVEFADEVVAPATEEKSGGIPTWSVFIFLILIILIGIASFFVGKKVEAEKYYDDDDYQGPTGGDDEFASYEAAERIDSGDF